MPKLQRFVEFRLLPTAHGVVVARPRPTTSRSVPERTA
jgi:hypothetical protein